MKTPITSNEVHAHERTQHLQKSPDDPLVGLALSGGGIRSACFSLGALQALRKLDLFRHLDYVSTVSGGGYIGGWLQAALARGCTRAIKLEGEEPREIRFLRAYSNYLTPKLGLFSGDTWAAVGNSLRNLILNFTILSLSLLVPLYLPWLGAALFWDLVARTAGEWGVLVPASGLFVLSVAVSVANSERPARASAATRSGASRVDQFTVYATVIVPGLVAIWLVSAAMWAQARHADFGVAQAGWTAVAGGLGYAAAWTVGLIAGLWWRRSKGFNAPLRRVASISVVIVAAALAAGTLGTFVMGVATHALAMAAGPLHAWLAGLLAFPIGVLSLMLAMSAHIGLSGDAMSDGTREWWGRVGGVQLLISFTLIVVGLLALVGPHLFELLKPYWTWLKFPGYEISTGTALVVLWALVTATAVLAGRSQQTATGRGNRLLELAGRVGPIVFVFGYLLILATLMHRTILRVPDWAGGDRVTATFSLCEVEAQLRSSALVLAPPTGARGPAVIGASTARAANRGAGTPRSWHRACEATTAPRRTEEVLGGLLLMLLVSGGLASFMSWQVDLNEFSLHTFYRNRLVRSFLGASRTRDPQPFTGFDDDDDLSFAELTKLCDGRIKPYPIFNAAINLVGGKNLAWQERKAASFVFTPDYCGFEYRDDDDPPVEQKAAAKRQAEAEATQKKADDTDVVTKQAHDAGVRRLSAYAKTSDHAGDRHSLTLGLALATSGAAASPNMGYHSSPTLAFLMTVFNVRLGWWLRNPRFHEMWTHEKTSLSLRELLYELLGMTTDDRKWVYLSDGGHFENLGVYELVRRRCRLIVACDAGHDGDVTFEDLGNAIERCRADFGVDIDIDLGNLRPGADRRAVWHCTVGTIRYDRLPPVKKGDPPEVPGTLLYIKSSLTGDEPADVLRYAAEHPAFPHESTSDQFFDESQFESYRALGFHAVQNAFTSAARAEECRTLSPVELFTLVRQRWGRPAPAPPDALRKYSAALEKIWNIVRSSDTLRFLDAQMFPEMPALMGLPATAAERAERPRRPEVNYWLPTSERERREGFYVCVQMLQLMEDVFLDFELHQHYDHIDNRGWMNLFQHWAWSGMLCATWAMTGSTFDPRFQRFCQVRLDLGPGRPAVAERDEGLVLPDPVEWRQWSTPKAGTNTPVGERELKRTIDQWQEAPGLNFWEAELVAKYMRATRHETEMLLPIYLTVESPRPSEKNPLRFNVGYIIGTERDHARGRTFVLHYMRIQNHLRKMGLAREALRALRETHDAEIEMGEAKFDATVADGKASDEGLPSVAGLQQLRTIVRSLPPRTPSPPASRS